MGNTSTTYKTDTEFIKEDCVEVGYEFQELLYHYVQLTDGFAINKPIKYDNGKATFELLQDLDFDITIENANLIGMNMAKIHNFSMLLLNGKELPYLTTALFPTGDDLVDYDIPERELAIRHSIMFEMNFTPTDQIPLHRDFRLHNIVFDGSTYNLIDFDFAKYGDASLEVMGMVVDLMEHGIEYVESFLTAYVEESKISIDESIAENYLLYLAASSFPYNRKDTLTDDGYNNLVLERSNRLDLLLHYYVNIIEVLIKLKNKDGKEKA